MNERDVSRLLAARENGTCEVKTPVGYIDVLTATTVYEVKEASQWKAAVGQVLALCPLLSAAQGQHLLVWQGVGRAEGDHSGALRRVERPSGLASRATAR